MKCGKHERQDVNATPLWVALLGFASTIVINGSAVLIAWLSLRGRADRIERSTNGALSASNASATAAHEALAHVTQTLANNVTPAPPTVVVVPPIEKP